MRKMVVLALAGALCGLALPAEALKRCWPANGCITANAYGGTVQVCIDGKVETKGARWTSRCRAANPCAVEDIDHIREPRSGT